MAKIHSLADIANAEIESYGRGDVRNQGLPSGIGLEEFVPGGIPRDKVTIVFADVATFKTTVAAHILLSIAATGHRALLVSLEDSASLVAARWLSQQSGVPYGLLAGGCELTEEQQAALAKTRDSLAFVTSLYVTDNLEANFDRIVEAVERIPGCAAVVVDYVQLLSDKGSDQESIANAVKKAQVAAKRLECAFILISQQKVDREDYHKNPRPQLRDLFGSSQMRMGAKLIVALFRPWCHVKVPTDRKGPYGPYAKLLSADSDNGDLYEGIVEVHVLKNVLGPTGMTTVHVDGPTGRIAPISLREYV